MAWIRELRLELKARGISANMHNMGRWGDPEVVWDKATMGGEGDVRRRNFEGSDSATKPFKFKDMRKYIAHTI